jgi:DNA-binding MarR family transcriptional regulator
VVDRVGGQGQGAVGKEGTIRFGGSGTHGASDLPGGVSVEELVELLRNANFGLLSIVREVSQKYPFPQSGMVIIAHIVKNPGSTISRLARETGYAKSHVSKTVDMLYAHGFVDKREDPCDRRVIRLFAAEELGKWFEAVKGAIEERLSEVLSVLPQADLTFLVKGLEMLNKALAEFGYAKTDCSKRT